MRLLAAFALWPVLALADPAAVPSSLPPYVRPIDVLDGVLRLPDAEAPDVRAGQVCYGPAAHLRLTMALQLGEGLSDERARLAWAMGAAAAREADAPVFNAERRARLEAEAQATVEGARLQAASADAWPWWQALGAGVGLLGLGAVAGIFAGVAL